MINKRAVEDFLKRKLNNYDWLKGENKLDLQKTVDAYMENTNWWNHQRACFLLVQQLKRFMLFIDMGGGKTFICLSLLQFRKWHGEKPKAIVFVPFVTSVSTWIDETAKHYPNLVCVPLTGTTQNNLAKLKNAEGDLFVICYASAVAMLGVPSTKFGGSKKKLVIEPEAVREVFAGFDTLFLDEVHKCKSIQSLTFRMVRTISSRTEYTVGLTGTPFGRDLQDLWPQFYLIDFGETLGHSLGFYRSVFFKTTINYWGGWEHEFKKSMFADLQRTIKNTSIRYAIDELHDLPDKKYISKRIEPHSGIANYAAKSLAIIRGVQAQKSSAYRAVESEYLKLRMLSSGFMTLKGEETEKLQVAFDENPKLDVLEELVDEMPWGCKMVVFHHFVYTNTLISDRLKKMKVGHARVFGKSKDPISELRKFSDDDKCRVLVINSRSGSSSLNLQHANYLVFFEQPDSPIDRQQAERRCWRPGQSKKVFIYDFLMQDTADWPIHNSNRAGRVLLQDLLDGKAKL